MDHRHWPDHSKPEQLGRLSGLGSWFYSREFHWFQDRGHDGTWKASTAHHHWQPIEKFLGTLKSINQGFTVIDGQGANGPVKLIFLILNRQNSEEIQELVNLHIPESFCSISDVQATASGVFNDKKREIKLSGLVLPLRKSK